jgi:arabinogalactan endo-1,4-beta-galactosidase
MLWPNGKTWGEQSGGFDGLAALLKAGIKGAKDASPNNSQLKIMLHLEEGNNNGKSRWFFDEIKKRNIAFDWIGLSYYPFWNGPMRDLQANMDDLVQRYKKPVIVVETAIGHTLEDPGTIPNIFGLNEANKTPYTVSPDGQGQYLKDLISAVQQVPKNLGIGVFYWEPAWIPTPRGNSYATPWNAWKNQALFNYSGEMLTGLTTLGTYNTTAKMLQLASEQLRLTFSNGDSPNAVTKKIVLPKTGLYQSSITWKSSLPNVISNQGIVSRPKKGQPDKVVTLIATIKKDKKMTNKSFKLTIKAQK